MIGQILVDAAKLLAIRDALVAGDPMEAYHQLRLIADPDATKAFRNGGNHWADLEAIRAAGEAAKTART